VAIRPNSVCERKYRPRPSLFFLQTSIVLNAKPLAWRTWKATSSFGAVVRRYRWQPSGAARDATPSAFTASPDVVA